ncbi:hypothetical protein ACUR5C_12355 [Aliikangiella sp. IMCC44653]
MSCANLEVAKQSYCFLFKHNYCVVQFFNRVTLKELVDSFSALVRHPKFEKNMSACYDMRCAFVEVDLKETEIFYHFAAGMIDKRGADYRLAFVYGDEMTKMLAEFYRLFLSRTQIEVEISDCYNQTLQWLEKS